jgi:hypothetical protein
LLLASGGLSRDNPFGRFIRPIRLAGPSTSLDPATLKARIAWGVSSFAGLTRPCSPRAVAITHCTFRGPSRTHTAWPAYPGPAECVRFPTEVVLEASTRRSTAEAARWARTAAKSHRRRSATGS